MNFVVSQVICTIKARMHIYVAISMLEHGTCILFAGKMDHPMCGRIRLCIMTTCISKRLLQVIKRSEDHLLQHIINHQYAHRLCVLKLLLLAGHWPTRSTFSGQTENDLSLGPSLRILFHSLHPAKLRKNTVSDTLPHAGQAKPRWTAQECCVLSARYRCDRVRRRSLQKVVISIDPYRPCACSDVRTDSEKRTWLGSRGLRDTTRGVQENAQSAWLSTFFLTLAHFANFQNFVFDVLSYLEGSSQRLKSLFGPTWITLSTLLVFQKKKFIVSCWVSSLPCLADLSKFHWPSLEMSDFITLENFINGEFVACDTLIDNVDPSRGEVYGKVKHDFT